MNMHKVMFLCSVYIIFRMCCEQWIDSAPRSWCIESAERVRKECEPGGKDDGTHLHLTKSIKAIIGCDWYDSCAQLTNNTLYTIKHRIDV